MENELEKPIGTIELKPLSAGSVTVKSVAIEPPTEGSKALLVNFYCKHPDKEEPIRISNVKTKKIQGNNETIKKDTLWYNLDDDENIRKTSSVADVIRYYNMKNLQEFVDTEITTEQDASGFLCIKAY